MKPVIMIIFVAGEELFWREVEALLSIITWYLHSTKIPAIQSPYFEYASYEEVCKLMLILLMY